MNRYGLADRFPELAARARRSGRPISVLRHTAAVLGDHLRPFELAYRIGGRRVRRRAARRGPRRRGAGRRPPVQGRCGAARRGLAVTVTIGVGCDAGAELGYERLFAEADAALYRAKAAGARPRRARAGRPARRRLSAAPGRW